jgi:hypothetical protein
MRGSSKWLNMIENVLSSILYLRLSLRCRFFAYYLDAIALTNKLYSIWFWINFDIIKRGHFPAACCGEGTLSK